MHEPAYDPLADGLEPLLRQVFERLKQELQAYLAKSGPRPTPEAPPLDPKIMKAVAEMQPRVREYIVLACDVRGLGKKLIAKHMKISEHTADEYCRTAYEIFKVHSGRALVRKALQYGVVELW